MAGSAAAVHHPVDEAPLASLFGGHEEVALDVPLDLLLGAPAVAHVDLNQLLALPQDLAGLDLDVAGLSLDAGRPGLVDDDLGVGQGVALAGGAGRPEDPGPPRPPAGA